ncbi:hypothetical protein [Clostridium sp. JN-1]|jgi:DNA-binding IscR family transcriptional regulator|uniref:hypothetical protein n=1 Tax=Clostridium sp. JN-1 TaxID=2483110 RepID=UPI000F0B394F|nr:hypothetical protein [Clostridium sp. JN-1]
MSKHRERGRGNSLNDILRDIDINQIISLMSALGMNRNNNNNNNNNRTSNTATNNNKDKDVQEFAKLLANPKFLDIVNNLSRKVKNKEMDEKTKQEEIKKAFNQVNVLIKKDRN